MHNSKRLLYAAFLAATLFLGRYPAHAQPVSTPAPVSVACAQNSILPTIASGQFGIINCDPFGRPYVSGVGFTPIGAYATPISVTSASATALLPSGPSVIVYNTGTNIAYVKFGQANTVTATTSDDAIPAGGGCGFYVYPNSYIAAITASSTTTLNVSSGTGMATGCWGGGSGVINGTVTANLTGWTGSAWVNLPVNTSNVLEVDASSTAIQGSPPGTPPPAGNNALTCQGNVANIPLPVSGTITANLGTLNGAATATGVAAVNTTLGSPMQQTGGTVGIVGTPTVNLGTIAGVATAANQTNAAQKTQIVDGSGNVIASTSNNLDVQCANCSGSGVSTADEATFTAGTSLFAGSGGFFQTTPTNNALTNGQQGEFQVTANRALFTNLRNASGTEIGTSSNPVRIDPTGTTASPLPTGASTSALQTTINTTLGSPMQNSGGSVTANAGTNLNTSALALDATLTGGTAKAIARGGAKGATTAADVTSSAAGSNHQPLDAVLYDLSGNLLGSTSDAMMVRGTVATGAAPSMNPLMTGLLAQTALTTTTTGNATYPKATLAGAMIEYPWSIPESTWSFAGASGGIVNTTTAVTIEAAGAAGIRNYITGLDLSSDTLGAATEFAIRDGASGTVIWRTKLQTTPLAPTHIPFVPPLRGSAATLTEVVTLTASVTGGVYVDAQGFQGP